LAREPERRYQHASDVKDEVESVCKLLPAEKTAAGSSEAKSTLQRLIAPAVGMLVVGTALTLWLALAILGRLPGDFKDWWIVGLAGPLLLVGGIVMKGGRSYWLAFAASLVCLAIGFATLYFIFLLPPLPIGALFVGGYSLWQLMQPDVVEAFRQQARSGISFGRRRLVITVTLVLPMLALVCAAPLFNQYRQQLALREATTRVEDQPTAPAPDTPSPPLQPPGPPTPEEGPEASPSHVALSPSMQKPGPVLQEGPEEGPDAPVRRQTNGVVSQQSRGGNELVVRMARDGEDVAPSLGAVRIDYAPYQYDGQKITLFGDQRQRNAIVFIFDCSHSMGQKTMIAPQAVGGPRQITERMDLAKDHFASMLDELARRNAGGGNTRVGVRFFGHRLGWSIGGSPPKLMTQDEYAGPIPDGLTPAEDVELVQPLGPFGQNEAERIRQRLQSVRPWGETPLYLALIQALDDFDSEAQNARKSIVVITDGEHYQSLFNSGGRRPQATTLNMLLESWNRRKSKTPIHILGFDLAKPEAARARAEYSRLASATGGSFAELTTGKELLDSLRRQTTPNAYVVCNDEGLPLKRTVDGDESPSPLNAPVEILTNRLPQQFTIFYGSARKQVVLEGGEAVELYVPDDRADIVARPYEDNAIVEETLVGRANGTPTDYVLRAHRPIWDNHSLKFPISLQRNPQASHYTVRPVETWVEITPLHGSDHIGEPYVFYDTNYEPLEPVPVLAWSAEDWPPEADRARIRFWCKYGQTQAVHTVPLREVLRSPTHQQHQPVNGVEGVELKVEMLTESDGRLRILVTERDSQKRSIASGIRVQLQTDPVVKPIRVVHQFDRRNGLATHAYYFLLEQRKSLESSEAARILVARAEDVKEAALQLPSEREFVVSVGNRGNDESASASDNGQ
jgi:Mg-chelatase subunit ChlD